MFHEGKVTFGKTQAGTVKTGFEKYTLSCRAKKGGPVLSREKVRVDRGGRVALNLGKTCSK